MEESTTEKLVEPLSRRDFIKLLAGAGLGLGFALTGLDRIAPLYNSETNKNNASNRSGNLLREASAQTGSWQNGTDTSIVGIHSGYVWTNKLIVVEGSSFNKQLGGVQPPIGTQLRYSVYNLSGGVAPAISMGTTGGTDPNDLFCCHQAQLPNGDVLFAGGTQMYSGQTNPLNCGGKWRGLKKAWKFNHLTDQLEAVESMTEGRWYPTMVCLPDGNLAVFAGNDSYGAGTENQLVEIWDWVNETWFNAPQHTSNPSSYAPQRGSGCGADPPPYTEGAGYSIAPTLGEYPRMHLVPSGLQGGTTGYLITVTGQEVTLNIWNPAPTSGQWTVPTFTGGTPTLDRFYGTSILLPLENVLPQEARIVVAGGKVGGATLATNNAQMLTIKSASSVAKLDLPTLNHARVYPSPVILPDGMCVLFGGTTGPQGSGSVGFPEYLDPTNPGAGWTDYDDTTQIRTYHSSAVLLADGRVWNAGGTTSSGSTGSKVVQYFSPPYITSPSRPSISNVTNIGGYGSTLKINTNDAQQIDNTHGVSLVKLGTSTHHFDPNQRMVWLGIVPGSRTSTSLLAYMPVNGILAPPGYYMIHVLEGGIPSAAKIIKIPGNPDQTTPILTILTPSAGQVITGPSGFLSNVTGQASDGATGSGIIEVKVRIGTNSFVVATTSSGFATWTASPPTTSQGPTTIQAIATDGAGNTSSITIPITVTFT